MTLYRNAFMGSVAFEELKRYNRQATEFGRELVNILSERAQVEQTHAKTLRRLGQRLSKASSLVLGSPLSHAWKTIAGEMEKEAEVHREFGYKLTEDCVKPLSLLTEGQIKRRRMMEQQVEATGKTWIDRHAEHVKTKKRLHLVTRENESLIDQITGPRPKTEKDQQKLVAKQFKQDETLQRSDSEYYQSLLQLERSRQEWESASFACCDAAEEMDGDRFGRLCDVIRKYADNVYEISSSMKTMCHAINEATKDLAPSKEMSVVCDKLRAVPYVAEQLLCDYYEENFNGQMTIERRRMSVNKLLERYINDCQKERAHKDGLTRLQDKSPDTDLSSKLYQSSSMLTFFDVIRYKLSCALASLSGSALPNHPLSNNIEHHTDKQGIVYSTLKLKPGEADEKMKNTQRNTLTKTKSYKQQAPSIHASISSYPGKSDDYRNSHERRLSVPVQRSQRNPSLSSMQDHKQTSDQSSRVSSTKSSISTPPLGTISNETAEDGLSNGSRQALCHCVAIYNYAATRNDELSINEGDVIKVYEKGADDWWKGEVRGRIGMFPANYVDSQSST